MYKCQFLYLVIAEAIMVIFYGACTTYSADSGPVP